MIHGVHQAFFVLGGLTILSTIIFRELKSIDGTTVSQHKILHRRVTKEAIQHLHRFPTEAVAF
jgi:hypothetical protein